MKHGGNIPQQLDVAVLIDAANFYPEVVISIPSRFFPQTNLLVPLLLLAYMLLDVATNHLLTVTTPGMS